MSHKQRKNRKEHKDIHEQGGKKSPAFTEAMTLYPKRTGGNSAADAWKAWCARLNEGVTETELVDGVKRYAAYCRAEGIEHGKYVKMSATFFGPGEHWKEDWVAESTSHAEQRSPFAGAV